MKEGWVYKKLGEVGLTQTGTTPSKQIKAYYGGDIPFIRPAELNIDQNGGVQYDSELKLTEAGALKSRIIKANSVLMCCIGSVGKTGFTLNNVTCNQQINTLTPYDNYNPRFVYYALISPNFQQEVVKIANSAKATLPIISKGKWAVLSIPVPPLSDQHRIVSRLDSAFSHIDELKAKAEKQLCEAKALFQKALAEEMKPKEGWEVKTLKEIGLTQTGTTPSKSDASNYGDFIPFIRPSEIDCDGCGNLEYNSEIKLSEKGVTNGRLFKKHSILMVCIGATISKVGYSVKEVSCNQQINVLTPKAGNDFKYVYYAMQNQNFKNKVIKEGTSAQATLPIINKGKWEQLTICIPISIDDQHSIVTRLDALSSQVHQLEENCRKTLAECDALKQAMLREVFE